MAESYFSDTTRSARRTDHESFALAVWSDASPDPHGVGDRGVSIYDGQIGWTVDGQPMFQTLSSIGAVDLEAQPMHGGAVPTCRLAFSDGTTLRVVACSETWRPDAEQTRLYRAFLEALHRRLSEEDRAGINFSWRFAGSRKPLFKIGMGLSLLLILASLWALVTTHELRTSLCLIGGLALFWALKASVDAAARKRYDPDKIPSAVYG